MQRHERIPRVVEASPSDPEALRSQLMRAAVRLTEAGSRLHPENTEKFSRDDAIEYMLGVVEDINTTARHIAARALTPENEALPEPADIDLKPAS